MLTHLIEEGWGRNGEEIAIPSPFKEDLLNKNWINACTGDKHCPHNLTP